MRCDEAGVKLRSDEMLDATYVCAVEQLLNGIGAATKGERRAEEVVERD